MVTIRIKWSKMLWFRLGGTMGILPLWVRSIVPVGRSGNSAPITKTHDVWTSADLRLVMKQEWNDPRSGKRTVELEKLSRTDPDVALFRVPPGYEVKTALQTLQELEDKLAATQN